MSNISYFNSQHKKSVTREDTGSHKANPLETYKKKPTSTPSDLELFLGQKENQQLPYAFKTILI